MNLDFSSANRIIFGVGAVNQLGSLVEELGERALVIRGSGNAPFEKVTRILKESGIESIPFIVSTEPTISMIEEGASLAREANASMVVSIGGGSAIDTGKAISTLLTNPGNLLDYLEVVGSGKVLSFPPLPFIAIPTTAGTGSEVTKNAVIGVPGKNIKVSLRSVFLLPRIALVDPALTLELPKNYTAFTGMDAITQLIEPYVTLKSNWLVDAICLDGLTKASSAITRAFNNPNDNEAREMMSYASLLSGMALANAGLGAVHGFAGPIGGMFGAPHGAICARLLPAVVRINIQNLSRLQPSPGILGKYGKIARTITGDQTANLEDGIFWLEQLCQDLEIPGLADYGVKPHHFDAIIERSSAASSMKGNPASLGRDEMREILECSL